MTGMINIWKLRDKPLQCLDCGADFTFAIGEQRFFFNKGLSQPKRCPQCRQNRRETLVRGGGEL